MAKTRKPQQQRSRETVATIIEACLICVSCYGADASSTRRIAETAGISVGSLYEYFANKEEVFNALHEHVIGEIVAMVKPLTPRLVRMGPAEAVRTLLFAFRDLLQRNNGAYLSYATHMGQFTPTRYLKPLNQALTELTVQFLMFHPDLARVPNLPVMSYIMIHGGIGTVIRHLGEPNPSFEFEALTEGLANMVQYMIEGDLRNDKSRADDQRNSSDSAPEDH